MLLSSLLVVTAPVTGVSPLGTGLLIAGVLFLAVAHVVQGERLAAVRRDLEALRQAHAAPTEAVAPLQSERAMFGSLYDEPEPSLVERCVALVQAQPVRVATGFGVAGTIAGIVMLGGTARAPNAASATQAEVAALKASHDSLRTTLAVIVSGAAAAPVDATAAATVAQADRPAPKNTAAAAPVRRAAVQPTAPVRPARRSAVPSAAILPPPPRLGAATTLPAAPVALDAPPAVPPKP